MDKEMEVLSYLGEDKVFDFLLRFKELETEYRKMKKIYDKRIKEKLKEIVGSEGIKIENDIFRVSISQPQETDKVISVTEARKLPQEIKDLILKKGMTSSRMVVTLIEDETEEDW